MHRQTVFLDRWFSLILTYAGFRAPPIVPGEQ